MDKCFGKYVEQAKDELSCFKRQEDYLESLESAYEGLISSVNSQVETQVETS